MFRISVQNYSAAYARGAKQVAIRDEAGEEIASAERKFAGGKWLLYVGPLGKVQELSRGAGYVTIAACMRALIIRDDLERITKQANQ